MKSSLIPWHIQSQSSKVNLDTILSKLEKSDYTVVMHTPTHDQNVISSKGGQDTSACQISANYSNVFSRKCPETTNLTCLPKLK